MRNKIAVFFSVLAMAISALALCGCAEGIFEVSEDENGSVCIGMDHALKGSESELEDCITVGEDEKVLVENDFLNEGEVELDLYSDEVDCDSAANSADASVTISGRDPVEFELVPGKYSLEVRVIKTSSGFAKITVVDKDYVAGKNTKHLGVMCPCYRQ